MVKKVISPLVSVHGSVAVGIDMVDDDRVRLLTKNPALLKRVYQPSELKKYADKLASIISIKEAAAKSINQTPPPWLDLTVSYDDSGKPLLEFSSFLRVNCGIVESSVSVTHCKGLTTAIVIVVRALTEDSSREPEPHGG